MDYKQEYELLTQLFNAQCREDFKRYLTKVHPKFIMGKHIEYLANKVQDLVEDKIILPNGKKCQILIISMPPQHGKSMTLTESFPSWYLGNNPDNRVIIVGYNSEFSKRFGRRNLRKVQEYGKEIFDIELAKERDDEFEIAGRQGVCISRGILSGITGNPGDLIVIDKL